MWKVKKAEGRPGFFSVEVNLNMISGSSQERNSMLAVERLYQRPKLGPYCAPSSIQFVLEVPSSVRVGYI